MRPSIICIALIILLAFVAPQAHATENSSDYAKWESRIAKETETIKKNVPEAEKGDEKAMAVLIGLADGEYIDTAEGGEWLNEIYLDLMVMHPYSFLLLVSKENEKIRERVITELLAPVTDKYSQKELKEAVVEARERGLKAEFIEDLMEFYSQD